MDHPARHGGVGQLVDQDEATKLAAVVIGFENDVAIGCDLGDADAVETECLGGEMLERVDVDFVFRVKPPSSRLSS